MFASIMAWPGAIAIGVSLGLLGSGGSRGACARTG